MPTITPVQLAERSYDIVVGAGVLDELGPRAKALVPGRHAFLVTDHNLPRSTIARARTSLEAAGFRVTEASANATEPEKSLATVERLLEAVGRARLERRDPVIALGGGIVGDVTGFVAASYRRGVPFIQCPTTLLAMVDASVGGKTGVNLVIGGALRKNMVGAFWQPRTVLADIATLASLPERERRAGLAECLKHGLICAATDPALFDWTVAHADAIARLDAPALTELVTRNVAVKAAVVAGDEREEASSGGRALLNLGHTFGHA
ncbi:MAG: iron-containing alcohol dehydrogenase, partial [Phycisphaerales bacterium]|nr:iron-containing alcohol dehydrogenase [Phycisphaerales bacterium]